MKNLSLSVIIPLYNESKRLPKLFEALRRFINSNSENDIEVIFVNDGSMDDTIIKVRSEKIFYPHKIISYGKNLGKGYALKEGIKNATKQYILLADADVSTPFEEFYKFERVILPNKVVIGTRKNKNSEILIHQPFYREKMGQTFTEIARILTGIYVSDFTCGFKCFPREMSRLIAEKSTINRWSYDAEFLVISKMLGLEIIEVPVKWINDKRTSVRIIKDTIKSFTDLIKIRINILRGKYK